MYTKEIAKYRFSILNYAGVIACLVRTNKKDYKVLTIWLFIIKLLGVIREISYLISDWHSQLWSPANRWTLGVALCRWREFLIRGGKKGCSLG